MSNLRNWLQKAMLIIVCWHFIEQYVDMETKIMKLRISLAHRQQ